MFFVKKCFKLMLFVSLVAPIYVNSLPLEQQEWFFPSLPAAGYDQDGTVGGRSVNINITPVSGTMFSAEPQEKGSLINPGQIVLSNPNDLNWFLIEGSDPSVYDVTFTALAGGVFVGVGEAFSMFELNGDLTSATSVKDIKFFDIFGVQILDPVITPIYEDVSDGDVAEMFWSYTGGAVQSGVVTRELSLILHSGAMFLVNDSGVDIGSISMRIDAPNVPSVEFLRFGLATNGGVPIPEPSTYLSIAGMLGICALAFACKKRKAN